MFLRFHRLPENRVAAAVLLFHGASRFFHVIESFRLDGSSVRNNAARGRIDLQDRAAARASYIKIRFTGIGFVFHHRRSYRNPDQRGVS